ncbi:TnsA endonuclease N-terminal domain-containing protein [Gottfriedia sp. NPDC056225]|uniref:TnsA endonuclease N-terminal domain-containing protein n=1 Tax=Gottfriedia sp. NPDC056225 TaxID=3345751 RepID=UPI0035D87237
MERIASKYRYTKAKHNRFIKEGRGQGEGKEYSPWIDTNDVPSVGRVHRVLGYKTGRTHAFFSDLEEKYFYLCEWSKNIKDIREQFPLNLEDTIRICEELNIDHPFDPKTDVYIPFTTDFLLTVVENGKERFLGRTIKPVMDLNNLRTIEKFEVERIYYSEKGIDWGIVTEKELPEQLVANIEMLYTFYTVDKNKEFLPIFVDDLLTIHGSPSVIHFCKTFDKSYQLENGTGLGLFKCLVARRVIEQHDFQVKLDFTQPITEFIANEEEAGSIVQSFCGK